MNHTNTIKKDIFTIRLPRRIFILGIVYVFYFFVFFSYIQILPIPLPIPTDTQPYALLISIFIFLVVKNKKMPIETAILIFPFLFSILLLFISKFNFTSIRSISNYASLFFISFATYNILRIQKGFSGSFLKKVIYIWFIVGFIQTFFYSDFLVSLLSRGLGTAGSGGRGVLGLSPEPTFYGITCIFLLLLTYFNFDINKNKLLIVLLIIQILIFAKSSMAALFLVVFATYYVLIYFFNLKKLFVFSVIISGFAISYKLLTFFDLFSFKQTRMYKLAILFIESPSLIILEDEGSYDRFFHILYSFAGFFQNYFLPHGFTLSVEDKNSILPQYGENISWSSEGARIMSGYGAALFELGFVGLLIPLSLNLSLYKFYKNDFKKFLLFSLFLNTILLTAIPLALPIIGFLIGYLLYYEKQIQT